MSRNRIFTLAAMLMTMLIGITAAESNRIYIPNVQAMPGKSVSLPVYLDNTQDIVALEFTLTMPDKNATLDAVNSTLTDRVRDHQLVVKSIGNNAYKVTAYSMYNSAILGQSGKLINLTLKVPSTWTAGETKALNMSNVVLSLRSGENVMTGFDGGSVTVTQTPHADIVPKNVTLTGTTFTPGETITVGWTVENIGESDALGGWGALVTLIDEYDATFGFEKVFEKTTLSKGGSLVSKVEFKLPTTLGIDGKFNVKVELVPSSSMNELIVDQGNNTTQTRNYPGTMGHKLTLTLPTSNINETDGTFTATVGRSGNRGLDETVRLISGNPGRISVPQTVKIPAGQATAKFTATVIDNNLWDKNEDITVTAELDGYGKAEGTVALIDDETAILSIATAAKRYTEDDRFDLTITATAANAEDVRLMIGASPNGKFDYNAAVTLPAGQTQVTVPVTVNDNNLPELSYTAKFTANAANYTDGAVEVTIDDNDTPDLELVLQPNIVSESDGPQCVLATVRKTSNVDKPVNVRFPDNSGGQLIYSVSQVGLPAGVAEANFWIGVVDNANVDGNRDYTIRAGVYYPNKVTASSGKGFASAKLTVTDDDGPTLKMTISKENMKEGTQNAATLTISRNTSTEQPLTVSLSSTQDERLEYAKTVTIAAGQQHTTTTISVKSDDTGTQNHAVMFTAAAENFTSATCAATIVNQTLPDLSGLTITPAQRTILSKGKTSAQVTVTNNGTYEMKAGTVVYALYSASKSYAKKNCAVLAQQTINKAIAVGETVTLDFTELQFPEVTGTCYLYALAEAPSGALEISETNNASNGVQMELTLPFTVKITTDKHELKTGENITISGKASGQEYANAKAWLVYKWNGQSYKEHSVQLDERGMFTQQYTVPKPQPGTYTIEAYHMTVKRAADEDKARFFAYGWRTSTNTFMAKTMERGTTYSGSFTVTNDCEKPLTNINIKCDGVPEDATLVWHYPKTIAGNSKATISFDFTPMSQTDAQVTMTATLSCDECDDVTLHGSYVAYNPFPNIKASDSHITTTATKGRQRTIQFNVGNTGNGASGNIYLALPTFMKALSGNLIPSLAYGEYATVTLAITPDESVVAGTKLTGQIGVNCENGKGFALPYTITVVSEETGTLHVDVCDEYTYYNEDAPQVKAASVTIRDYNTGSVVYDGLTNERGFVEQTLTEGYYKLSVKADGHESYNGTVMVDPGVTTVKTVNLAIIDDIKVTMTWEETEVEDVYEIVTTTTFETAVPKPQLKLTPQGNIDGDHLGVGESLVYSVVVTNNGLITAKNVRVSGPMVLDEITQKYRDMRELSVTFLTPRTFDLRPKESTVVTYEIKRVTYVDYDPCTAMIFGSFEYNCGTDTKSGEMKAGVAISQTCRNDGWDELPDDDEDDGFGFDFSEEEEDEEESFMSVPKPHHDTYDSTRRVSTPITDVEDEKGIVIASVKLQFNQRLTLTRQAFRGTLTIENGTTGQMKDIELTLTETDPTGKVATSHEFEVHAESINGFGGSLNGPWTLDGKKTATATILYIPTKYAAPYEPVEYSFGGQLSFTDPTTGMKRLRDLTEQTLTVKPSPNLDLTYFMQRDVYGDDALTAEIEPMEEAEFSLIINNVGYGEAKNVNMVTQQPQIIDNEQGLLINFEITRALLNGKDETLAMGGDVATPFGTIPAHGQAYAQWFFTSTLMGHFTDYDVKATHLTSYDNPDLTLLNEVTIHELIRSVNVPGTERKGFLCNDEDDDEDLPDAIYITDGTKLPVAACQDITITETGTKNVYRLTVTPITLSLTGWAYGKIRDPKNGNAQVIRVVRESDGREIDPRNVWITHATMRDGHKPLYENMLHIADDMDARKTSYLITYEDRPATPLEVKAFSGLPSGDEVAHERVTDVQVTFNKPIHEATFTVEDLQLMVQGNNVSMENAVITKVDDVTYNINMANVPQADGLHILTVQTRTIDDIDGYYGKNGKQRSWNQFTGEAVGISFALKKLGFGRVPETAATVTVNGTEPQDGYAFGTEVTLGVMPAYGYTFDRWAINGTTLSTEPTYKYTLISAKTIELWLTPQKFNISFHVEAEQGEVSLGDGLYEYDEQLEMTATPKQGYRFKGWYEQMTTPAQNAPSRVLRAAPQQALISENPTITYTVKGETRIYPVFEVDKEKEDVNNDRVVDTQDAQVVVNYFHNNNVHNAAYDVNGDGVVDSQDVQIVINKFHNSTVQ